MADEVCTSSVYALNPMMYSVVAILVIEALECLADYSRTTYLYEKNHVRYEVIVFGIDTIKLLETHNIFKVIFEKEKSPIFFAVVRY